MSAKSQWLLLVWTVPLSGFVLLTTEPSGDCITPHDVMACSAQLCRCRPVMTVTLLLIYSALRQASALKVDAVFTVAVSENPLLTARVMATGPETHLLEDKSRKQN